MADLEQEKDLEDDEFKSNVKPSTIRLMTTRICNRNVKYQFELNETNEDSHESSDSEKDDLENEGSSNDYDHNDGYSSPDIDYDSLPCYD